MVGGAWHVRPTAGAEQRRPDLELLRRPGDGEQDGARGPHRLGAHAQGRIPTLQGASGLPPALPERVRLPGPLDRGGRRARARSQLEARDRGVWACGVRETLPRRGRAVVQGADRGLHPARPMDGLGERLLHIQRHEHRVHLALPAANARAGLPVQGPPLHGVVPALRDLDLRPRAGRELRGPHRPFALRSPPAPRPARAVAGGLDDDTVDAARQRRGRGQPRGRVRPQDQRRVVGGRARPRRRVRRARPRRRPRRPPLRGPVRQSARRRRSGAPGHPLGGRLPGGGNGHRPHRPRLRRRGLRALPRPRTSRPDAGGRSRAVLHRLRLAPRPQHGRGGRADRRRPRRAREAHLGRARSSTATPSAGAATPRSSSGSRTTGSSPSTSCARS